MAPQIGKSKRRNEGNYGGSFVAKISRDKQHVAATVGCRKEVTATNKRYAVHAVSSQIYNFLDLAQVVKLIL